VRPHEHTATAPWQVASWDITYLPGHPERWAGDVREWERAIIVTLNPEGRRKSDSIAA
jgi:hypothetical protein